MRQSLILLLPLAGLLASACSKPELALADDPVERAAQCGIVAAAGGHKALTDVRAALPFAEQGRILHPAMLVAASDTGFDTDKASAVVAKMQEIGPKLTDRKLDPLAAPCAEAFPQTRIAEVTLPADSFEARLGCYQLSGFLVRALKEKSGDYADEMSRYGALRSDLDPQIASGLTAKGIKSESEAADALRSKSLASFARLGPPMTVIDACLAKFPGTA